MLVYDEKVHRYFWRISILTGVSPSRDSEIKGEIVRIAKTNAILKRRVNNIHIMTVTQQIRQENKS